MYAIKSNFKYHKLKDEQEQESKIEPQEKYNFIGVYVNETEVLNNTFFTNSEDPSIVGERGEEMTILIADLHQ